MLRFSGQQMTGDIDMQWQMPGSMNHQVSRGKIDLATSTL